ncbi:hypothetical protein CUMW_290150, partial [Citrus unshiu]
SSRSTTSRSSNIDPQQSICHQLKQSRDTAAPPPLAVETELRHSSNSRFCLKNYHGEREAVGEE